MDVLEAIRDRRSIRRYGGDPVPQEKIDKVLEAAIWAPSANNSQPWEFIILRSNELKRKVAGVLPHGEFLQEAPLGIIVLVDPRCSTHPLEDGAAATQNILLASHFLGLGSCWIAPHNGEIRRMLGIPEEKMVLSVISMGYPDESPTVGRKDLDSITFYDRYGSH
jgi:nitroreductase